MLKNRGEPDNAGHRKPTETWSLVLFLVALAVSVATPWLIRLTPGPTSAAAMMIMVAPLLLGLAGARLALETKNIPLIALNSAAAFVFMPIVSLGVNMMAGG